jgi:hypothetical protein
LTDEHILQFRVTNEDVHLLEISVRVLHGEWSAVSTAYADLSFFTENGNALLRWVEAPDKPLRIEAGADTGWGWMVLEFYTINRAGHVRCAITLATKTGTAGYSRPAETSRFSIELPTELGLVEHFARECIALGANLKREARLICLSE